MVILAENQQIKVNLLGKKQISQIYLNSNLEKKIIFTKSNYKSMEISKWAFAHFFLGA